MGDEHQHLHITTLCKKSCHLTQLLSNKENAVDVYLKFENTQPSGSFKLRGIGNLCQRTAMQGSREFVCSSGGNAGMAAAYAARQLLLPITVYLPTTTPQFVIENLKMYGAATVVSGAVWDDTNKEALLVAKSKPDCTYVPPFDHELIFDGNSTIIDELQVKPDMVFCSVGGGGLLTGVLRGLKRRGWQHDVKVVAVETEGADSLYQSIKSNQRVTLPAITSIAKSLGAKTVGEVPFKEAMDYGVIPWRVTDSETIQALTRILDEERVLVEPACACCFVPLYNQAMFEKLIEQNQLSHVNKVLVVVCGGSGVNSTLLSNWKNQFNLV